MPSQESAKKCGNPKCTKDAGSVALRQCAKCKKTAYCSRECQAASWPTHKTTCRRPNYIIKFHLCPGDITDPEVVRTLSCPADVVFYHLHMALQVAFGWATTHSFDFAVKDPSYTEPDDIMEYMTRRMALDRNGGRNAASVPREYLVRVVDPVEMTSFSGIDRMHEGQRRHVNTLEKKADKYKLFQLLDDPQYQGREIVYTYDFGDNWEHYLTVTGRAEPTDDFVCLDGSGHYVAEDAGSTQGWEKVKAAYRAAHPDSAQKERRFWFENQASNSDPAGLAGDRVNVWDRAQVNKDLANLFDRFERMAAMNLSNR